MCSCRAECKSLIAALNQASTRIQIAGCVYNEMLGNSFGKLVVTAMLWDKQSLQRSGFDILA